MLMIKSKDLEIFYIKMVQCIRDFGMMGKNMVMGHFIQKLDCFEKESGKMVRELDGYHRIKRHDFYVLLN